MVRAAGTSLCVQQARHGLRHRASGFALETLQVIGVAGRDKKITGADLWQDGQPRQFSHMDP